MRDEIVLFFVYHHATLKFIAVICIHIFENVLMICVKCVSRPSLYQCHGGCQANEHGLSLEQEGLGCAINSAYLNALWSLSRPTFPCQGSVQSCCDH